MNSKDFVKFWCQSGFYSSFFFGYTIIWAVKACKYGIVKSFLIKFILKEGARFQRNDLLHEIVNQTNSNIEKF